jgi:hypothetical protein
MPDILKGALDPRVASGRVVFRQPNDQPASLGEYTVTAGALVRIRPLPHDELPMPPQDRVRCDDARDLTQDPPTQPIPKDRQPASIVIGELEPLPTQLASEDPIFFHQIRDRLAWRSWRSIQPVRTASTI